MSTLPEGSPTLGGRHARAGSAQKGCFSSKRPKKKKKRGEFGAVRKERPTKRSRRRLKKLGGRGAAELRNRGWLGGVQMEGENRRTRRNFVLLRRGA